MIIYKKGELIRDLEFVEEIQPKGNSNPRRAIFKCKCGKLFESKIIKVKEGRTLSCGCSRYIIKHGNAKRGKVSLEYRCWIYMKSRCFNYNNTNYRNYGGRGITVCERWLIFDNFLEDMGNKPSFYHSIDRINVNGNYEPSNCRWATPTEQSLNKRKNYFINKL